MKIAVLIKEVPDTYGDRVLHPETGLADRSASEAVLDEVGERSLEVAISYADAHPETEIVAVLLGPESATATLRKGLAMGATSAVHVCDDALLGADLGLTAECLAAALQRIAPDLVITGNQSTDGVGGVMAALVAEHLDVPHLTQLTEVALTETEVSGVRAVDAGTSEVRAALPAVISITEMLPDGRFPNFKGIMAAKKKTIETLSTADLGVQPDDPEAARLRTTRVSSGRPSRAVW